MNTYFGYLYRDASNYKNWNEVIIKGRLTPKQKEDIISTLNEGLWFIPEQVGLPVERFSDVTEDDHCWCELELENINDTDLPATELGTAQEIYDAFMAVNGNWDDVTYAVMEGDDDYDDCYEV